MSARVSTRFLSSIGMWRLISRWGAIVLREKNGTGRDTRSGIPYPDCTEDQPHSQEVSRGHYRTLLWANRQGTAAEVAAGRAPGPPPPYPAHHGAAAGERGGAARGGGRARGREGGPPLSLAP